VVKMLRGNH